MRHGKSSWKPKVSDKDRPLSQRGIEDANKIGCFIASKISIVDMAFSSPAIRATHTALIVCEKLELPLNKFSISKSLYDFSGEKVLEFIRSLDNSLNTVITFGHNNACTYLSYRLCGFDGDNIPTAGATLFRFDVSLWSQINSGNAEYLFPKTLLTT